MKYYKIVNNTKKLKSVIGEENLVNNSCVPDLWNFYKVIILQWYSYSSVNYMRDIYHHITEL